ncbi:MAG: hypothetical protein JKY57_03200 [Kordiimonadaceae bacterium]|nr:hypothetical protein [Kordiimonadaceae bacterium]
MPRPCQLVAELLSNVAFDEDDIIELIKRTGREHHQILAAREDLSANVWIALARAAPSAPPFDHQSTIALWSDDLGILRTGTNHATPTAPSATISPQATTPSIAPVKTAEVKSISSVTRFPAEKVTARTSQSGKSRIRIIKTDEDLLAERSQLNQLARPEDPAPELINSTSFRSPSNDRPDGTGGSAGKNTSTVSPSSSDKIASAEGPQTWADTPHNTADGLGQQPQVPELEIKAPIKDPGPGGWAWRSDRDGLITSISPYGKTILGSNITNADATIMDLLGLNHKLGHPVARAFQRRSTIHDAPIFLADLNQTDQHWTLEATPFFSSGGGIFDGYEGILTPISAQQAEPQLPTAVETGAVFLDDVLPDGSENSETSFESKDALEGILAGLGQKISLEARSAPAPKNEATVPKAEAAVPKKRPTTVSNPISAAAASAIKDAIAETLSPISKTMPTSRVTAKPAPTDAGMPKTAAPTEAYTAAYTAPFQTPTSNNAKILATLDFLEEALGRLHTASASNNPTHTRLQHEIAAACARTLREQITGK